MDCLGHIITNAGIHSCADKCKKDMGLVTAP